MNLTQLFDLSFQGRRDQPALEFEGRTFTFGEIDGRSNRLAQCLARRGLKGGDRLCVYLGNSVEMIDLYLACVKLGVIFVPVNILYRDREIDHILKDAEPAAFVREADLPALAAEAAAMPDERPEVPLDGDAPAGIIYTSGTTGASKGAVLTHNNFAANALNLLTCWQITETDRFLLALPLFHVHGLGNGLHCWLASGCRLRLLPRFEHEKAAATFLDFRPTLFFGVPTIYVRLLDIPDEQAREIGGSMRLFVSGSAPLPAQVFSEFQAKFGHAILERYGMSENLMNISNPYAGERRPGTVGLPLPGGLGASWWMGRYGSRGRTFLRDTGGAKMRRVQHSRTAGSGRATWRCARRTATTRCAAAGAISSFPADSIFIRARSRSS